MLNQCPKSNEIMSEKTTRYLDASKGLSDPLVCVLALGLTCDITEQRSTSAAIREATKAISGAAQLSNEEKLKKLLKQPKLDAGSSGSSSIKKKNYDLSHQGGSPSERKNTDRESDKLPSRNTLRLVDSLLLDERKSNQNSNIADQGAPRSFESTPNHTTSSNPIKMKVGSPSKNGQLGLSPLGSKRKESGEATNNSGARENKQSRSASGSGANRRVDENQTKSPSSFTSISTGAQNQTEKRMKKRKPFGKLFEGVIFVMSGFQNPHRKEVRDRAVEMGARYKGDWDSTCTHLM